MRPRILVDVSIAEVGQDVLGKRMPRLEGGSEKRVLLLSEVFAESPLAVMRITTASSRWTYTARLALAEGY